MNCSEFISSLACFLSSLPLSLHHALELNSGCRATLDWHQPLIELGEHPSQRWLDVALDLFSKVGRHACKFVQSPAHQTGWQDHPGLIALPAVGICNPSKVLPPVCPVPIATGRKTIRTYCPESKYALWPVQRVCCCNCRFSNQPPVLFFHAVLSPSRQLVTHTLQLQSRIRPTQEGQFRIRDSFSGFVLSLLTTSQSRSLGSYLSGATEIHYFLQPRMG